MFRELKHAVRDGNVREAQRLIAAGVDVRQERNYCLRHALELRSWHRLPSPELHLAMVKCLVMAGADINAAGGSYFGLGSVVGRLGLLKFLASIGHHAKFGDRWMSAALFHCRMGAVRYLLKLSPERIEVILKYRIEAIRGYNLGYYSPEDYLSLIKYLSLRVTYLQGTRRDRIPPSIYRVIILYRCRLGIRGARAARVAYFWWLPRCYGLRRRSGARMRRRSFAAHRRLCAN